MYSGLLVYMSQFIVEKVTQNGVEERKGRGTNWICITHPWASAALPWICPILSHQEVDLSSHFHIVDPPAVFIALPLSPATRLLIVSLSLNVFNKTIHGEDSV
jgi:hypothetical protein